MSADGRMTDGVPGRGQYTEQARRRRLDWLRARTGAALPSLETTGVDARALTGNVENFAGATQVPLGIAGPLLVNERRSGLPDNSASLSRSTRALIDQNYLRAFVAVLPDGDVILGTTGEVSLIGLVEFLTRSVDRGGLESLAALNLSGADSIGLRVKTASSTISVGRQDVFLANSIIVH